MDYFANDKRFIEDGTSSRKAASKSNAELASHTRLFATIVTYANCLLLPWCSFFSFTQKTALSSYISRYRSLVFCVWKPCGCSTSDCDVLLRSCHTKRRDIVRAMSLSMRVLSVVPRYAVAVGSLKQSAEGEQR